MHRVLGFRFQVSGIRRNDNSCLCLHGALSCSTQGCENVQRLIVGEGCLGLKVVGVRAHGFVVLGCWDCELTDA